MYYEIEVKSHVRVPPSKFGQETKLSIMESIKERFDGAVTKELGAVLGVTDVTSIGEGVIIPGDGATYYDTTFKLLAFKPEMQEMALGKITDITDFGAFIDLGALDGMIHISQTMDDFVSFSKSNVLTGKESKRSLKVGDKCRARIIAVSYKEAGNPKLGLTMRQSRLGSIGWIEEDLKKETEPEKTEKKGKKE
ncbi:MAG TPA: DNA-directed RNA polymerase [Candidatus Nanoarchaeia archaeon]|nr:DNA-directed RNA polymerase [Candidatus Nanoarchaeia archaeon]